MRPLTLQYTHQLDPGVWSVCLQCESPAGWCLQFFLQLSAASFPSHTSLNRSFFLHSLVVHLEAVKLRIHTSFCFFLPPAHSSFSLITSRHIQHLPESASSFQRNSYSRSYLFTWLFTSALNSQENVFLTKPHFFQLQNQINLQNNYDVLYKTLFFVTVNFTKQWFPSLSATLKWKWLFLLT